MKNKRNLIQLCLLGAVLLLPAVAQAQFTFTINNGTATIARYTGPGGDVVIPDTTDGYSVTAVGTNAFAFSGVVNVTIPDSVTDIQRGAFLACSSLVTVRIGNSVAHIGDFAFSTCTSLASIVIPDSVIDIGANAFIDCTSATSVIIGKGVVNIRYRVFSSCAPLSLVIPNNVTNIESQAFDGCLNLSSVTIGDGVINMGWGAFYACTALTNVIIGANLINGAGFFLCSSLMTITVDPRNSAYSSVDGVLFNKDQTRLVQYPEGNAGDYTIPSGVLSIYSGAMDYCAKLTGVIVPVTFTNFGEGGFDFNAFQNSTSLKAITVPQGSPVYSSLDGVLFDKDGTTLINYPEGKPDGSYTIPDSVTSIDPNNFYFYNNLTNLVIGDSVTNIGWDAISACPNLTSVTLGKSVSCIGDFVFSLCDNLTAIFARGDMPTNVGEHAFDGDINTTIYYLPGNVGWNNFPWYLAPVLWLPQIDASGVQKNQFRFNINWTSDQTVVVEACTNLFNPDWQPVQTNALTGGMAYFSDPQWTNYPGRFYRLRSP
jgi:hypothetical protein